MNIKTLLSQKHWLTLISFVLISSGCQSIILQDATPCHVQDRLSDGVSCAHTNTTTDVIFNLDFSETVDLLQPQSERICVPVSDQMPVCKTDQSAGVSVTLPARGGSTIISADQYEAIKTEMEIMCRTLGKKCAFEVKQFLRKEGKNI